MDVLRAALDNDATLPVVLMTAFGSVQQAVQAMRDGAFDFIEKPIDLDHLQQLLARAIERQQLLRENVVLREESSRRLGFPRILGEHTKLQDAARTMQRIAPSDSTVLLLGESGTGKELFARAIHQLSGRAKQPLVAINCAAIPESLIENELFGHEKGAFTGAFAQKVGRFEAAHQGTLFLDEIGEIPLELQPKLLRALQEQEFERLGGNRTTHVDVRIVAATNRNLRRMVDEGTFRGDLYYRLHVFPLAVPPLRERREDVPLLIRFFTQRYARKLNRPIEEIPSAALEALTRYNWPGNIRELQHLVERSVILSPGRVLQITVPDAIPDSGSVRWTSAVSKDEIPERERILEAIRLSDGMIGGDDGAAARLGLRRTTLQSRMKKLGIARHFG